MLKTKCGKLVEDLQDCVCFKCCGIITSLKGAEWKAKVVDKK